MHWKNTFRKINGYIDRQYIRHHPIAVGRNTFTPPFGAVMLFAAYGAYDCLFCVYRMVIDMMRGTTPTHTFNIPMDASMIKDVMVIYAQDDIEVVRKEKFDCTIEGKQVKVTLTQEDTLAFNHRKNVQIQIRLLTTEGVALASTVNVIGIQQCLNNEVL